MLEVTRARRATLLMFLICGISVSAWAPMVPIVKQRLGINEAQLGTILLAMGAGAIVVMPFIGPLIQRVGSRPIIIISSICAALALPLLTLAGTSLILGTLLFLFGASMGSLDVSMNAQAVVVQERMNKPVMSSFHGMFSVGGLIGALAFGLLLLLKLPPAAAASVISGILLLIVGTHYTYFLDHTSMEGAGPVFRFPKGPVILLGVFCFIVFLTEGAMLDWSALFLKAHRDFSISMAGVGYAVFSVAMAIVRFSGDTMVQRLGPKKVVFYGSLLAAAGLLIAILSPWQTLNLLGFLVIGVGAANIVPIMFSEAGKADPAAPELALAAVTTLGYTGQLAGPALIGFAAHLTSLPVALAFLALPLVCVALSYNRRTPAVNR